MNNQQSVTVIRPNLTPEERERRMQMLKKAVANFCVGLARAEKEKEGRRQ